MTFKKDYNELLLLLLRTLVRDALHFEEIVSGSTSRLTHVEVKVEDLKNKVSPNECLYSTELLTSGILLAAPVDTGPGV